jgi:hypothetical protein
METTVTCWTPMSLACVEIVNDPAARRFDTTWYSTRTNAAYSVKNLRSVSSTKKPNAPAASYPSTCRPTVALLNIQTRKDAVKSSIVGYISNMRLAFRPILPKPKVENPRCCLLCMASSFFDTRNIVNATKPSRNVTPRRSYKRTSKSAKRVCILSTVAEIDKGSRQVASIVRRLKFSAWLVL